MSKVTVVSHRGQAGRTSLESVSAWRFCRTASCAVGYYGTDCKTVVDLDALETTPYPKSDDPNRLVCFCFGHTVAAVIDDVRKNEAPTLQASITDACRRGLDECEEKNPEGRCCLANVAAVIRMAKGSPAPESELDCCKL